MNELQRQKMLLSEEIKSIKIVNESSESEAIVSLQESMKTSNAQFEARIKDLNDAKSAEISALTSKTTELEKEKTLLNSDRDTCRTKIESLKNEKRDYEKTLEREIREKNELKAQVTNILQEIGRLEEQLKEVRTSHSSIQAEKQKLEDKI